MIASTSCDSMIHPKPCRQYYVDSYGRLPFRQLHMNCRAKGSFPHTVAVAVAVAEVAVAVGDGIWAKENYHDNKDQEDIDEVKIFFTI